MNQMKAHLFLGFALILKFIQCESCLESELCGSQVKFWIATTKNNLGQWITESGLEHPKRHSSVGWKLQVDGDSVNCQEGEMCRLVALITPQCNGDNSSDYMSFGMGRYKLHTNLVNWEQAKQICESENSHLAILDSQVEASAIVEIISKAPGAFIYIGFNDKLREGHYVDVFGKPVKNLWSLHQPDNAGNNENCGTVTKQGKMNDINCNSKLSFLCERP